MKTACVAPRQVAPSEAASNGAWPPPSVPYTNAASLHYSRPTSVNLFSFAYIATAFAYVIVPLIYMQNICSNNIELKHRKYKLGLQ